MNGRRARRVPTSNSGLISCSSDQMPGLVRLTNVTEGRSEPRAAYVGVRHDHDPLVEHQCGCLVVTFQEMRHGQKLKKLVTACRVETRGALEIGDRRQHSALGLLRPHCG